MNEEEEKVSDDNECSSKKNTFEHYLAKPPPQLDVKPFAPKKVAGMTANLVALILHPKGVQSLLL